MPWCPGCLRSKNIKGILKESAKINESKSESSFKDSFQSTSTSIFIQYDEISEDKSSEYSNLAELETRILLEIEPL